MLAVMGSNVVGMFTYLGTPQVGVDKKETTSSTWPLAMGLPGHAAMDTGPERAYQGTAHHQSRSLIGSHTPNGQEAKTVRVRVGREGCVEHRRMPKLYSFSVFLSCCWFSLSLLFAPESGEGPRVVPGVSLHEQQPWSAT